jgi:hypothetical protein
MELFTETTIQSSHTGADGRWSTGFMTFRAGAEDGPEVGWINWQERPDTCTLTLVVKGGPSEVITRPKLGAALVEGRRWLDARLG